MNEQTKGMTMEDKANFDEKKKEAAKAYQARKKDAKEKVSAYLAVDKKIPQEVREAILYLAGAGTRSTRPGVNAELKELLMVGPMSAVDIFQKFEYGRPTMNQKINLFIKADPEDRIWVMFEDGNYSIAGTGENPPKGWTGYTPVIKEEL